MGSIGTCLPGCSNLRRRPGVRPALVVCVLAAASRGLAAAESAASIVVCGTTQDRCAVIAGHAEQVRAEIYFRLRDVRPPPRWSVPCIVHVHATATSFAAAVGAAPVSARGATSLEFSSDGVTKRRIDVMGDGGDAVPDALAHELVHVVLADRFVKAAPPRWADEGLATLFDSAEKQRGHLADFQAAADRGQIWSARELYSLDLHASDIGRQRVFYGQSHSLVRWLLARKDAGTLLRFLDDAEAIGPDASLKAHYGLESLAMLDQEWRRSLVVMR